MTTAAQRTGPDATLSPRVPRLLRAARIVHPFPSLLNATATVGLAFVAADGEPEPGIVARMALAMLLGQFAIGVANDLFDRKLDAATKPWKPLAAPLLSPATAMSFLGACLAVALVLAATLGWQSLLLFALGTSCGLAYDAGLKRTLFSPLPFMIAIPVLPAWVFVTLDAWEPALWWLLPLGALLGLSIHLANTLPDIEADARNGVRGFAHVLGVERSMFVSWASFAAALLFAVAIFPRLDPDPIWYGFAVGVGGLCLIAMLLAFRLRGEPALKLNFALTSIGAAVCAAGWLVAVT